MRPLFPFYGSKWRDARRYQPPGHTVVEPFAGSAGYATYYEPDRVMLYDRDPIVVGVWHYLIKASSADILALPDLEVGQSIDDCPSLPQEARWLIGFWLNRGSATPKKTKTAFSARTDRQQLIWSERARVRIASDVEKIRHWQVREGSYETAPRVDATWFIDPPYVDKGRYYRMRHVNYIDLAEWCQHLTGPVIVCEQAGATWLPFRPLATIKSTRGVSAEMVWTSEAEPNPTLFALCL